MTQRHRAERRGEPQVTSDAGISIIEVLAATMIFMILSVGVAQATVMSIRFAGDQKNRVTALSLAASEVDRVRAIGDPFTVLDETKTQTVDGIAYTIHRDTSWVSGTGFDIPCGASGTSNLQYKRVNVRVTWAGQMEPIAPVNSDTILAPSGRINDPTRGTIIVSATKADGTGASGVTANITPVSGGAVALDSQPPQTSTDGCTYALQVAPGTYRVSLSRAGYIDTTQTASPSTEVTVAAGTTSNATFGYDAKSTLALTAGGHNPVPATMPTVITNSYVNTYGVFHKEGMTADLYPYGGYTPIAGIYVAPDGEGGGGCRALDPAEWIAASVGGVALQDGVAADPISALPGAAASGVVPMGRVQVTLPNSNNNTIKATLVNAAPPARLPGEPSCEATYSLSFPASTQATRVLALPYGRWQLTYTRSGQTTVNNITSITPQSNAVAGGGNGYVAINQVVLDPRQP